MTRKQWMYDFLKMTLVSFGIVILFSTFLLVIGIPSTQARNLYNQAQKTDNVETKTKLLEQSLGLWHTKEAADELERLTN